MTEIKFNPDTIKIELDYDSDVIITMEDNGITVTALVDSKKFWFNIIEGMKAMTDEWHSPSFTSEKGI